MAHVVLFAATTLANAEWKMYQRSAPHMGTRWHIALYSQQPQTANRAFERAFAVVAEIDLALSNYRADSELTKLCRSAPHEAFVPVSEHLWCVLKAADRMSKRTGGAFDVTVGPLTRRWRRAHARKELPSAEVLRREREKVGYQLIEFADHGRGVRLKRARMQIDLGGIAKGYAVDAAMKAIESSGVTSALVNGGGDLAVSEAPPGERGWVVTLSSHPKEKPREIRLANAAVATSGDAWQFIELDGQRYSHIVDPRTGLGVTHRVTASVIAPTCMQADAWASTLCVVPKAAKQWATEQKWLHWMTTTVDAGEQSLLEFSKAFPRD